MIKLVEIYLITNNNGLEAVEFYKDAFGAKVITCTTFGEAMENVPDNMKNYLLNASLDINGIRIQISDNGNEHPYIVGTNMTACVQVDNVEDAKNIFSKLSLDAQAINMEITETPWSPAYGIVVDKFGMTWQINTDIPGFVSENVKF
ncbi:VOC family protein [Gemella sp. GH3]|uniref:VOC family protein n=1 Tax=unclassified Gemella TaxID=2624949 RepID=UPI0015CFB2C6|nr:MULTISPECIES: VOC family protein [unclassified Gemella]MBF0713579.1 VOC family protein [Gemella sp. GH3.1]NYS50531.1 VOC family protein [Gemella sp. GH3]